MNDFRELWNQWKSYHQALHEKYLDDSRIKKMRDKFILLKKHC